MTTNSEPRASSAILHPVALGALLLWLANDHWAKAVVGGFWTGKLSDIASLIVFPLLPICALSHWCERRGGGSCSRGWAIGWIAATGTVMATINVFDVAAEAYRVGLAAAQWPLRAVVSLANSGEVPALAPVFLTMDPSDLLTLPFLIVPWMLVRRSLTTSLPRVDERAPKTGIQPTRRRSTFAMAKT